MAKAPVRTPAQRRAGAVETRRKPGLGVRDIRASNIAPTSYDAAARTVEAVLSTGAGVLRWYGEETLMIDPAAVDLSRVAAGQVKVLDCHNAGTVDALVGSLVSVRFDGGALIGLIAFADTDLGRRVEQSVAAGELNGISIGYTVTEWQEIERVGQADEYRATKWQLLETSFVTVPADAGAMTRSFPARAGGGGNGAVEEDIAPGATGRVPADSAGDGFEEDDDDHLESREDPEDDASAMDPEESDEDEEDEPEEGERRLSGSNHQVRTSPKPNKDPAMKISVSEALQLGRQAEGFGIERTTIDAELAKPEATADGVRKFILDQAAQAQDARSAFSAARVIRDERDTKGEAIVDFLAHRMEPGSKPTELARMFAGWRIADVIGDRLGVASRDPGEILQRASMTTGDFPLLLEAAANKQLLGAYQVAEPTYKRWAKPTTFNDFKPAKFLRIGDFPALQPITETADVPNGSFGENRETVTPVTRGVIVPLSRQMLINDDLGAFGDLVRGAGMEAARTENALAYGILTANSGAGPTLNDTFNLYSTQHANYAGTGTAVTLAALQAGRAAMRKQKGVGGTQPLNLYPSIIVVGPDKELEAQQIIAPIQAQQIGNVNPFSGKLDIVVDAQMVANNAGLSWNLFAEPSLLPCVVYGYLRDSNGPQIVQFSPANVDGIQLRVLHDFGVGAVDYRGTYRNLGA